MAKFKFKSKKQKNKFNFIFDKKEILDTEIYGTHIELYSNQRFILDGCIGISDYQTDYVKLKLKKGHITLMGVNFLISAFENENIIINGKITSIEFCI